MAVRPDLGKFFLSLCTFSLSSYQIGPKGYAALRNPNIWGSTRLHIDLCAALNVTVHASPEDGTALWHIFKAEDAPGLRKYLLSLSSDSPRGSPMVDPIHGQQFYLDADHLSNLREHYNIVPFIIEQRQGQGVLIPTGCPHQVCVRLPFYLLKH